MPSLVLDTQGAFVTGRMMHHNIFLSQELIKGYHQSHISPRCLLKIDLHKAYDTVSWTFLEQVLRAYGFDDWFVSRVMTCVSTTRLSFNLNGRLEGLLEGKQGLIQGDPLSRYLFVLYMDYPTRLIKRRVIGIEFKYIIQNVRKLI